MAKKQQEPQDAGVKEAAGVGTGGFVHLHLHSEYSLLDGGNRLERLVKRVKELGMGAVAVTDHGNLHAAMEFYDEATKVGIKPILGIEAYVAPGDRTDKTHTGIADGGFHLVLLAENETGWKNLLKLSSDSFLNGFYYKPRMDKSTLRQWGDGLIAINGHLGSSIAHHLLQYVATKNEAHYEAAVEEARWHAETFGTNERGEPRFFVELQRHDVEEQERINPSLIRLARELGLPLVADNDAHFLAAEDHDVHDTLCCISMAKNKNDTNRNVYSKQLYVKSPAQMAALFTDVPEAIENAVRIAERCNVTLPKGENHAPVVRVQKTARTIEEAKGSTEWFKAFCGQYELLPFDAQRDRDVTAEVLKADCDAALRELAEAGLVWRYGEDGITDAIRTRLDGELTILADKLISAYFLIVWDFVSWARRQGIPAFARGSGVGTMVGYVLGLSNACPERYGLLFERFTDPDRSEYPDIDIDICQNGRGAVIDYVRKKYGHVAQIITFGRLKARAGIKDVARVMGLTPAEGQRLANMVPAELNITIEDALAKEPELKKLSDNDATVQRVLETARALEDHARHAGVHAAGVVVATQPLDNIVPLCKATGNDEVVTQWDGPTCEKRGLLKMDFLGLRTLSTIELAKKLIRETLDEDAIWKAVGKKKPSTAHASEPHPLDLDRLTYDDQRVFDLFRRGDVAGVFQFESGGMRKLLVDMKPDRIEDLIAANALFRPGPMDLIPQYVARKHGREEVPRLHPMVDQYTIETYGIMVYQEQVMQILHALGGVPLRAAYTLIKAISKKRSDVIDEARPGFVSGAKEKGLTARQADDLFDLILKFAGYGFNKSHSTGYAIIAYETAYLKTYFPGQYMAAVLTYESQARKVEEWRVYIEECGRLVYADSTPARPHVGVEVKPPDINLSEADFSVVFLDGEERDALHGHVRFGIGAIKGVGEAAIKRIIEMRKTGGPFRSLFDYCERVDAQAMNKATLEALIKCGAFDSVHGAGQRAAMVAAIPEATAAAAKAAEDRRSGQMNMFESMFGGGGGGGSAGATHVEAERALPRVAAWDMMQMLALEREYLGFHVSGHPLDPYDDVMQSICTANSAGLSGLGPEAMVRVGGMITKVRTTVAKRGETEGQKMAMITLQDRAGNVEGVAFPGVYARVGEHLRDNALVVIEGRIDKSRAEPGLLIEDVVPMEQAAARYCEELRVDMAAADERALEALRQVLSQADDRSAGRGAEVFLVLEAEGRRVLLKPRQMRVVADKGLVESLREIVGKERVLLRGMAVKPRSMNGNGKRQWEKKSAPAAAREAEVCASIDRY